MNTRAIALILALSVPSNGAIALNSSTDQDRVAITTSGSSPSVSQMTVFGWFRQTASTPGYMALVELRNPNLTGMLNNGLGGNIIACSWIDYGFGEATGLQLSSEWSFMGCTINGSALKMYQLKGDTMLTYSYSGASGSQDLDGSWVIGQDTAVAGSREFGGDVAGVGLYYRALTDQEMEKIARSKLAWYPNDGLVGLWKFDECVSGTVVGTDVFRDYSGNGNEGSPIAGSTGVECAATTPLSYP